MNQEHFEDFCNLLDNVAEQYGKTLSPSLKGLYWQGLHDEDFNAVQESLFRHIRRTDKEGKFMPKVSDIREMTHGSSEDSSLIAWSKVDSAVRTTGPYQSVVFDDSLIHCVIKDMGGWINLGSKAEDEWPFVAREFQNRYKGFKSRGIAPEYESHLIGIAEAHNNKEGFRNDHPRLIGDIEKAKQVMNKGTGYINYKDVVGLVSMQKDIESAVGNMAKITSNRDEA